MVELGRRIAAAKNDPRSTYFLRQRLSIAIQRGNAASVLGTMRSVTSAHHKCVNIINVLYYRTLDNLL